MEVEVKLRLPDKAAHDRVAQLLAPGRRATHQQENYFFDGANKELSSQRAVLRTRFYDTDAKAVLTLKGKQLLVDGIGRATEVENDVDPAAARRFLEHPDDILAHACDLVDGMRKQFAPQKLVGLGGFRNTRDVFDWDGQTIELDATQYDWGNMYEIECETTEPKAVKAKLEQLLKDNGIPYSYTKQTKFANFIQRSLI